MSYSIYEKEFICGDRLKQVREDFGKTQAEIAKLLNIGQNALSQYETEYVIIPIKHLIKLSDYFDVSLDYLFHFTNVKLYKNSNIGSNLNLMNQRLKQLRKENNITQNKLADIIHTSKSTISEYERKSNKIIATSFLYEISKKYRFSADYLLGKIDDPKYIN